MFWSIYGCDSSSRFRMKNRNSLQRQNITRVWEFLGLYCGIENNNSWLLDDKCEIIKQ